MKKKILFILICISSCQFYDKKIPNEKYLLNKEIKTIDWNHVDEFPSISNCDSLDNSTNRKNCFVENLSKCIQLKLNDTQTEITYPIIDTIQVEITILIDSTIQYNTILKKSNIYYKNKIDSILKTKLTHFPKIKPALKRGVPVKTVFVLPIILKNN